MANSLTPAQPLPGEALRRLLPALIAAVAWCAMAWLYLESQDWYRGLVQGWGVTPFSFPFLDTDTVLSALRCRRLGVDVFATNPCDALGRVYDYSPLWLLGAYAPVTEAWITPVGLAVDAAFLLCLALLPPGRDRISVAAITLGALSTASVFALERGNNDLVIFALAATAAALSCRGPYLRRLGYAGALLAGLLKYYPMTLLVLAARERLPSLLRIASITLGALAIFILAQGPDLWRALALIPTGSPVGDMFGARTLPAGLALLLGKSPAWVAWVQSCLAVLAVAIGSTYGTGPHARAALDALTATERACLLAGALLILSCFFTAQNIGYRAIHLLLVLPAFTALRSHKLYGLAALTALALLWAEGWRHWADLAGAGGLWPWLVRDLIWWAMVTLLLGLLSGWILRAPATQAVFARLRLHHEMANSP